MLVIETLTIDSPDPDALAMFYEDLLGYVRTYEDEGEIIISAPDGSGLPILFLQVDDPKVSKNRMHFDLRPDDHDEAVARALQLGATHVDIGQHADPDVTWTVLADPDGNELCILATHDDVEDPGIVAEGVAVDFEHPEAASTEDEEDDDDDDDDDWDDDDEE